MSSSETRQNARYGNLAQLYPFGSHVVIILTARGVTNTTNVTVQGKVIYTDGLGIAIQDDGATNFYPWQNVVCVGADR